MPLVLTVDFGEGKGKAYGYDDCCVKTAEEVKQILENCGDICYRDEINQMLRRQTVKVNNMADNIQRQEDKKC